MRLTVSRYLSAHIWDLRFADDRSRLPCLLPFIHFLTPIPYYSREIAFCNRFPDCNREMPKKISVLKTLFPVSSKISSSVSSWAGGGGGGWGRVGLNPYPEFLICCSILKPFYLWWKASDLLNSMRYILGVVGLLEACDVTNNGRHLGRQLGFYQELGIRSKPRQMWFFFVLYMKNNT